MANPREKHLQTQDKLNVFDTATGHTPQNSPNTQRESGKNDLGSTPALPLSPEPWKLPSVIRQLLAQTADCYALDWPVHTLFPPPDNTGGSMCFLTENNHHPEKASSVNPSTSPPFTFLPHLRQRACGIGPVGSIRKCAWSSSERREEHQQ